LGSFFAEKKEEAIKNLEKFQNLYYIEKSKDQKAENK
jgi:hypothetical protein